jgi:hypothetical protein
MIGARVQLTGSTWLFPWLDKFGTVTSATGDGRYVVVLDAHPDLSTAASTVRATEQDATVLAVRSTTGRRAERGLHWLTDEVHPYCLLDGYVVRVSADGAYTQRVNSRGVPVGKVLRWSGLGEALTMLGWEAVVASEPVL